MENFRLNQKNIIQISAVHVVQPTPAVAIVPSLLRLFLSLPPTMCPTKIPESMCQAYVFACKKTASEKLASERPTDAQDSGPGHNSHLPVG